jgi:hypothetical protein
MLEARRAASFACEVKHGYGSFPDTLISKYWPPDSRHHDTVRENGTYQENPEGYCQINGCCQPNTSLMALEL